MDFFKLLVMFKSDHRVEVSRLLRARELPRTLSNMGVWQCFFFGLIFVAKLFSFLYVPWQHRFKTTPGAANTTKEQKLGEKAVPCQPLGRVKAEAILQGAVPEV